MVISLKVLKIKSCMECPCRTVFYNEKPKPPDWTCSKSKFVVISNINNIPDWCPLEEDVFL